MEFWVDGISLESFGGTLGFQPVVLSHSKRWATSWQSSSGMVAVSPVQTHLGDFIGEPNLFSDPQAAFLSYRDPMPGETGDRNILRAPGYLSLDAGLHKTFRMPWEGQLLRSAGKCSMLPTRKS